MEGLKAAFASTSLFAAQAVSPPSASTSPAPVAEPNTTTKDPAPFTEPGASDNTPAYLTQLRAHIPSKDSLRRNGFVVEPLTTAQIESKKRCEKCHQRVKPLRERTRYRTPKPGDKNQQENVRRVPLISSSLVAAQAIAEASGGSLGSPAFLGKAKEDRPNLKPEQTEKKKMQCSYHAGFVRRGFWSCCLRQANSDGCTTAENHTMPLLSPAVEWLLHPTPTFTPSPDTPDSHARAAVALDCEMGCTLTNETELIRVTLIDYFTSEVLLDSLVYPDVPLKHYNTRYSGVDKRMMNRALQQDQVIRGKARARERVWEFVGPDTVVVGHGLPNDLSALRWIHESCVDSLLVEMGLRKPKEVESKEQRDKAFADSEGEGAQSSAGPSALTGNKAGDKNANSPTKKTVKTKGALQLKNVVLARLGRQIQNHGRFGHDSLEDAVAARDLVHLHVSQEGAVLEAL